MNAPFRLDSPELVERASRAGPAPLPIPRAAFTIGIGVADAVPHYGWRVARQRLLDAALARPGLTWLLGPPGTGKTLMLQEVARAAEAAGAAVMLHARGDLPATLGRDGASTPRVILVDEAARTNVALVRRLLMDGRFALILAALPGSLGPETVPGDVVRLGPLPDAEIGAFVTARLRASGLPPDILGPGALRRLAILSGGVPRVLNMLMASALYLARANGAARIDLAHLDEAAALRNGDDTDIATAAAGMAEEPVVRRSEAGPCPSLQAAEVPAVTAIEALRDGRLADGPGAIVPAPRPSRWLLGLVCVLPALVLGWAILSRPSDPVPSPAARQNIAPGVSEPEHGTERAEMSPPSPPAPKPAVPAPPAQPLAAVSTPADPALSPRPTVVPALPAAAPAMVTIAYLRRDPSAPDRAANVAAMLRTAGFVVPADPVQARADARPGALYGFAEDRTAAQAVLTAANLPPGLARIRVTNPPGTLPGHITLILPAAAGARP